MPLGLSNLTIEQWTAIGNVALTVGLLAFAGMQWWVTKTTEDSRKNERTADEAENQRQRDRQADLDFQTVWAEHFRLESLAKSWANEDLVLLAALGVLRGEHLLPRDWPTVARAIGQLSVESGYLGSVALTLAHDLERQAALLSNLVGLCARQHPTRSAEQVAEQVRDQYDPIITPVETGLRQGARELALLMWDVANHSPRSNVQREMQFRDDLHSRFAREAIPAIKDRESLPSKAQPGNDAVHAGVRKGAS